MVATMLTLVIFAFLVFAGWSRWAWWTPVATFAAALPLMLMSLSAVNSWRGESGLATCGVPDTAINMLVTLALYYAAYGLGFGAARLFRGEIKP